jgi:hypothetical protein
MEGRGFIPLMVQHWLARYRIRAHARLLIL